MVGQPTHSSQAACAATKYFPGKKCIKAAPFPETLQLLLKSDTCNVGMKEDCFCVFRRKLLFFVTVNTLKGIKGFCCCWSPLPEGRWASFSICLTVCSCVCSRGGTTPLYKRDLFHVVSFIMCTILTLTHCGHMVNLQIYIFSRRPPFQNDCPSTICFISLRRV